VPKKTVTIVNEAFDAAKASVEEPVAFEQAVAEIERNR